MRKTTAHISKTPRQYLSFMMLVLVASIVTACAQVDVPQQKPVSVPAPQSPPERKQAINEKPDAVQYLPLGQDVLVPERDTSRGLPEREVGPYELRGETLAGALKLITSEHDIPIAFQTDKGLSTTVTVAELKGPMDKVIQKVCGLANLYCSFENGMLTVKETEVFTVALPPISSSEGGDGGGDDTDLSGDTGELLDQVSTAIEEITGNEPVVDESTRTLIYRATQRTSDIARRYFQRLRSQTAMVVYKVYIWEVTLDSDNSTGIDWNEATNIAEYDLDFDVPGGLPADSGAVSIGLQNATEGAVFEFISNYGSVKTISQPHIAMLSGSQASFSVADTRNFVSEVSEEQGEDDENDTVNITTSEVDSGFDLTISSNWSNSSIYSTIDLQITDFDPNFRTFPPNADSGQQQVQLADTEQRELTTNVRMRPGDSMLLAGLVDETDNFEKSGPGAMSLFFPTDRTSETNNRELVILLEPSVTVFSEKPASEKEKERVAKTSSASGNNNHSRFSGIKSRKIGRSHSGQDMQVDTFPPDEGETAVERGEAEQTIEYDVFNPSPE